MNCLLKKFSMIWVRRVSALMALALVFAASAATQAGIFTWTGAANDNWQNGSNYSPTSPTPTAGDTVQFGALGSPNARPQSTNSSNDASLLISTMKFLSGGASFNDVRFRNWVVNNGTVGDLTMVEVETGNSNNQVINAVRVGSSNFFSIPNSSTTTILNNGSGSLTIGTNQTINLTTQLFRPNGTSGNSTLLIDGSGNTTIGAIGGAGNTRLSDNGAAILSLTKQGGGTLTLNTANIYTGLTSITAGTISYAVSNAISTGNVTVDGSSAILALGASSDSVGTVTLDGGGQITSTTGVLTSTGSFELKNGSASAILAGSVALNKTTSGVIALTGANTYSGMTSISAGTLLVNNTHTTAGAYSVTGTGILGGLGTITTASNAGITIAAGGKLAPGTSPGTLTANLGSGTADIIGAITAANSQSMLFDLDTPATSDRLLLSNALSTLAIGSGLLEFDDFVFTSTGLFGPGTYTLFDTANTISGTLGANLSGTVGGYAATIEFRNGDQDIVLNVVPEPGTFAMLLFGGVMMWFLGRKRSS